MKLIVGLGNPGPAYSQTRHNAGFGVAERLCERWKIPLRMKACSSKVGEGKALGEGVKLAMPQTFMNASGPAVKCLLQRWRLSPASALVVCDDVSLPLGVIRLRPKGSDGGHQGLHSVLETLGTDEVPRLRVGIRPADLKEGEDLTPFVLGRFSPPERKLLEEGLERAAQACEVWLTRGVSAAMNRFNQKTGGK